MLYIGRIGGNAVVMGEDDEGGKGGFGIWPGVIENRHGIESFNLWYLLVMKNAINTIKIMAIN